MRLAEKPGEPSRAARTAAWLRAKKDALERLSREHVVDYHTFGSELAPTTLESLTTPPPRPIYSDATHLREALANLRARYEGRDLGGVIVFSDGVDNGRLGAALADKGLDVESTDFLRSLDVPIHAAWIGRAGLTDVAIARVLADDFAFVRTSVTIEAVVRVVGRGKSWDGKTLPVTLR